MMNKKFLWSAQDRSELASQIERWETPVPDCRREQKPEHLENWALRRTLSGLVDADFVGYPFCIYKSESPDFLVISGGEHIGIEVTELISQSLAAVDQFQQPGKFVDLSLPSMQVGAQRMTREQLSKIPNEKLTGPGWSRNEQEKKLEDDLKYSISKKHDKLKALHFEKFYRNILIVYDNQWMVPYDIRRQVMDHLISWYYSEKKDIHYNAILILRDCYF